MFMLRCATTCPTRRPFCFLILSTPSQTEKNTYTKVALKKSCDIQESLSILFVQPQIQGLGIPKNPCLLHAFHTSHPAFNSSNFLYWPNRPNTPLVSTGVSTPFLGHWATNSFDVQSSFFASTICVNTQYTVRFLVLIQIHVCHILGTIFHIHIIPYIISSKSKQQAEPLEIVHFLSPFFF